MTATGPVLRDIHLPPAAWWPPAPGWWLVAGLIALTAALATWWWMYRHASRRVLRAAMREVDALQATYAHDGNSAALAAGASRLVRRIALRVEPSVAALHGEEWRAFLRWHAPDGASAATLARLVDAPFRNRPELDADALLAALRGWCRRALRGYTASASPRRVAATPFVSKGGVVRTGREVGS